MTYELHEHTADIRIKVKGTSPENLFVEAAEGMLNFMKGKPKSDSTASRTKRKVKVSSPDETALLVDFLNEILALSQINDETYSNIKVKMPAEVEEGLRVEAELEGLEISEFEEDIKAVTYHEADVKKNDAGEWEASLIFDI